MAVRLRLLVVPLSVAAATTGCAAGSAVAAAPLAGGSPNGSVAAEPNRGRDAGGPQLTSPDFPPDGPIPTRFTCEGAGDRPTLSWSGMPAAANSLAIVVLDPDAPVRPYFVHWVVYGLPAAASGTLGGGVLPAGARETRNGAGKIGWKPPCPPSGTHHYHFTLYADRGAIPAGSTADTIAAIQKQAIVQATLTGTVAAK
jgi:Raf kinase inhibitor-like YbhB/YbcL family protein